MAALVATGFGAPFAGLLGAAAGLIGAATAVHNIAERAARHRLEADAELAMDIISILGVGQLAIGARMATLPNTVRGFQTAQRLGRFLALYNIGTEGATAVLIPLKLSDDLARIDVAKEAGADHVKRHGLRCKDGGLAQFPHDEGANAERIAAGDQAFFRQDEQ